MKSDDDVMNGCIECVLEGWAMMVLLVFVHFRSYFCL